MMLIGMDARYGLRRDRRGIGLYIYNLLEALERQGGDCRFVLYADTFASSELVRRFSNHNFRVRILSGTNLLWWEQVLLPVAAFQDKVDLLHCPSNMAPMVKVCPTVLTILDVIEFRRSSFGHIKLSFRHRLSRIYRMNLLPYLARRADMVITISKFSRKDIMQVLSVPKEKIRVTYLGLPRDISTKDNDIKDIKARYIFALGAMDRRKNVEVLLEAFYILRTQGREGIKLVIAGVENLELFRRKTGLDKHPFRDDIKCLGFVRESELENLYRHCTCFVYPSLYEGFGLPPLEAMACGAPVIASGSTSVGEIIGEAGLLFDPTNPKELVNKIGLVLDDPSLADSLRKKGKERLNIFSWQKCAKETVEIYRKAYDWSKGTG